MIFRRFHALLINVLFILACAFFPRVAVAQLGVQLVAENLTAPLGFVQVPSDPTAQVILQQGGRIRLLENGALQEADYLDLSGVVTADGGEAGLLGLAFSPHYADDGRVFVCFIDSNGSTVVSRFRRSGDDPLHGDPDSRVDLIWPDGQSYIEQVANHHYGGNLAFGPDGYLYVGLGDGDWSNDPGHHAQDPTSLHGKMLRLDVAVPDDDPEGYNIPADNPFVGLDGVLGMIWDFGLRNPWRWSFDDPSLGGTGALIIADVGQDVWEEVDYEPMGAGGRNYGWRNREGSDDNVTDLPAFSDALVGPIFQMGHDTGRSIIGGVVYRGQALGAQYQGRYFFGDFVAGQVWSLGLNVEAESREASAVDVQLYSGLATGAVEISSFGVDASGEMYLVSYGAGAVFRVVRDTTPPPPPDVDGDGVPDTTDACPNVAAQTSSGCPLQPPAAGQADFDGDGKPDVVFQYLGASGLLAAWRVDGLSVLSLSYVFNYPGVLSDPGWSVVGTSDLTGDNKADLLYQNQFSGQTLLLIMNGTTWIDTQEIVAATNWHMMATGDFNRDGHADLVWENFASGAVCIMYMTTSGGHSVPQQTSFLLLSDGTPELIAPSPWRIAGAGDVDGDGWLDLVWQDTSTGNLAAWFLQNAVHKGSTPQIVMASPSWKVRAVADFNADGHPDLIFHNDVTGQIAGWLLNGTTLLQGAIMGQSGLDWQVVGAK